MMRRIALEEHFVVDDPAHIARWKTLVPDVPDAIVEKILPNVLDVGEKRIEAMASAGIDLAVLSNVGTVQGALEAAPALKLAREGNDYLARVVQRHPEHYAGFATVPLQDPKAGADELDRAVTQLGMKGALIIGQTNGTYLDHDSMNPFWERAQALDVPVYIHASDPAVMPTTYEGRPELIGAVWSWNAETAAHALRLIFGGVFDRHPRARVMLGHLGETLPFLLWRLDRRAKAFSEGEAKQPAEIIRSNFAITTAGQFSDVPLQCSLQALGEDAVMFSVDHPFESMTEASAWFDRTPLSDDLREKISWRNAARMLKL